MKVSLMSCGLIPALLFAAGVALAEPSNSKSHANTLSGTVASVDSPGKILVVRDGQGRETRVVWTGATHMSGGTLKTGEKVTVRWLPRDGKKIATVVKVHTPQAETTASVVPPPAVSPTPTSR